VIAKASFLSFGFWKDGNNGQPAFLPRIVVPINRLSATESQQRASLRG